MEVTKQTGDFLEDVPVIFSKREYDRDFSTEEFNKSYKEDRKFLLLILMRKGFDYSSAEDIAHETLMLALRKWGNFQTPYSKRAWLNTVSIRVSRRLRQSSGWHKTIGAPESLVGNVTDLEEIIGPTEDEAEKLIESLDIRKAIDKLSHPYREMIIRMYLEDQTIDTVAESMKISLPRMQRLHNRALNELRDLLREFRTKTSVPLPTIRATAPYEKEINLLSHRRREVMRRYAFEGMDPHEIALELNISTNCARVTLSKALTEVAQRSGDNREIVKLRLSQIRNSRSPREQRQRTEQLWEFIDRVTRVKEISGFR